MVLVNCLFMDKNVNLLHNYRAHVWLKETHIDALIAIIALALFVLLAR